MSNVCGNQSRAIRDQARDRTVIHVIVTIAISAWCALASSATPQPERIAAAWQQSQDQFTAGNLFEAARLLRGAESIATTDEQKAGTALRLGIVLTATGDVSDAATQLDTATKFAAALSVTDRAKLPQAQGNLAARNGDYAQAEQQFDAATVAARSDGLEAEAVRSQLNALRARLDRRELALLDSRLAAVHAATKALPRSEDTVGLLIADAELHRRAVNEFRSSPSLRGAANEALTLARDYAATDASKARAIGMLGSLYEDEMRSAEAVRLTSQAIFLAQAANDTEQTYRWEWQAARLERRQGKLIESSASLGRALNSLSSIRDDVLLSSRQAFALSVEPVYLDYADVSLRQADGLTQGGEQQQNLLRGVRNQLESLKQAEVQDYFANQCSVNSARQNDRFDVPGTAVIYPILLADRVEILVENEGELRRFTTPINRGEATFMIRRLRQALERANSGAAWLEPSQKLYQWLMSSAAPWLDGKGVDTLVVVPSGPLRTIPLAALHDGQRFLIQKYAVATTPAISLVSAGRPSAFDRMFLGGLTKPVQGFVGLPGVAAEMRSLSALVPAEVLQDETFQLGTVRSQLATPGYSVAHLATHGEFSSDYQRSFILTFDDRLTMAGLRSALQSRATPLDLLVLSACQTAAGDDRAALGLAGVAIQAGARSALASLWSISDTGTAELMTRFYTHTSAAGATKARSLRLAQIDLLESKQFSHPAYWAPYLLIGNWQ